LTNADTKAIKKLGLDVDFVDTDLTRIEGDGWRVRKDGYNTLALEVPCQTYEKYAYRCEYKHVKTGYKRVMFQEDSSPDEAMTTYGFEMTTLGDWKKHQFDIETDEPVEAVADDRV
jgi:hypothetical protein